MVLAVHLPLSILHRSTLTGALCLAGAIAAIDAAGPDAPAAASDAGPPPGEHGHIPCALTADATAHVHDEPTAGTMPGTT